MEIQIREVLSRIIEPYNQIKDIDRLQQMRLVLIIDVFGICVLIPLIGFRNIMFFFFQGSFELIITPAFVCSLFILSWILGKSKYYIISYPSILIIPLLFPLTQLPIYFSDIEVYRKIINVVEMLTLAIVIAGILYPYRYFLVMTVASILEIIFFYGILLDYEVEFLLFKLTSFVIIVSFAFLTVYTSRSISKRLEDLRDTYSHDLGNNLQIIKSTTELISRIDESSKVSEQIELIDKKLDEAGELINEIRRLH